MGAMEHAAQQELADVRHSRYFPAHSTIVHYGEPVTELYCIAAGRAKAVLPYPDDRRGALLLCLYKAGDVIGLRDLFGERRHTVTVIALEEVHVCAFPAELVERHARQNPHFGVQLIQLLAHEIEAIEQQLWLFQRRSVRDRLAHLLLLLQRTYGSDEQGFIQFPTTPASLAELLQVSVPAVRRALDALARRPVVRLSADRIGILDTEALSRLLRHG